MPPAQPGQFEFWHEEQLARLCEMFPGWEIWWVRKAVVTSRDEPLLSWHARPRGARMAVCHADKPDDLAFKISKYAEALPGHISAARRELERTPVKLSHLHAALERELRALLALRPLA